MSDFSEAWALTSKWEGGYSDNPNDPGNYNAFNQLVGTNHGITPGVYQPYLHFVPSKEAMQDLTLSQAAAIANQEYWVKYQLYNIRCQALANNVFDVLFHFRPTTAALLLQQSIKDIGGTLPQWGMDGVVGSETITALVTACETGQENKFIKALLTRRIQFYNNIVATDSSKQQFYDGWINRAEDFGNMGSGMIMMAGTGILIPVLIGLGLLLSPKK